jgi:hypothetical protein
VLLVEPVLDWLLTGVALSFVLLIEKLLLVLLVQQQVLDLEKYWLPEPGMVLLAC